MTSETIDRSERRRAMWLGNGALLVLMITGVIMRRSAGADAGVALAWLYGIGTMAIAAITARATEYPRWAWFGTAAVLALALVAGALTSSGPIEAKEWASTAWMIPWIVLLMSITPSPRSGWCSPGARWGGAFLMGFGVVFAMLLVALPRIVHRG
jgi:hypothetical protein